jgi:hypothetical protein
MRFRNTNQDALVVIVGEVITGTNSDRDLSASGSSDSSPINIGGPGTAVQTARFHVYKAVPNSKAQADLLIAARGPSGSNCSPSYVRILALNTQE